MAKTSNLYARIEPDVKEQAEDILSALGIPVSNAINILSKINIASCIYYIHDCMNFFISLLDIPWSINEKYSLLLFINSLIILFEISISIFSE